MNNAQRITPVLVYHDVEAAHTFLVSAFGLGAGRVDRDPSGQVVHGEVHAGTEVIWLHRTAPDHGLASPRVQDFSSTGLAVLVDDVDTHCGRARAAGARIDSAPVDQSYGRREYGARDPEGHRWWFGSPSPANDEHTR